MDLHQFSYTVLDVGDAPLVLGVYVVAANAFEARLAFHDCVGQNVEPDGVWCHPGRLDPTVAHEAIEFAWEVLYEERATQKVNMENVLVHVWSTTPETACFSLIKNAVERNTLKALRALLDLFPTHPIPGQDLLAGVRKGCMEAVEMVVNTQRVVDNGSLLAVLCHHGCKNLLETLASYTDPKSAERALEWEWIDNIEWLEELVSRNQRRVLAQTAEAFHTSRATTRKKI